MPTLMVCRMCGRGSARAAHSPPRSLRRGHPRQSRRCVPAMPVLPGERDCCRYDLAAADPCPPATRGRG
eukprot:scaffold46667_cov60-Phaeocystis_antarctica.AAC.6